MQKQKASPGAACPSCKGPTGRRNGLPIRCSSCAKVRLQCITCGIGFQRDGAEIDKHARRGLKDGPFCSKACNKPIRNPQPIVRQCAHCGSNYRPRSLDPSRKFCSRVCYCAAPSPIKVLQPKPCAQCGLMMTITSIRRKYCGMSCKNKAHSVRMQGSGNSHFTKATSRDGLFRRMALIVLERDWHCCAACGTRKDFRRLSVHHIDHDPDHNEPYNLISLCSSCHNTHHRSINPPAGLKTEKLKGMAHARSMSMTYKLQQTATSLLAEY